MSSSKARLARHFANLRHLWFLLTHLCCLGSVFWLFGDDVLGTCVEQLHWAATEQNQSSCTMASILWLDVELLYCSVRFPEALSDMSGRRASVLQALLSAYLRPAVSMRRSQLRYAVTED